MSSFDLRELSWASFFNFFASLWNTQIIVLDGNPITVGKITLSLFLLISGAFFAKYITKTLVFRVKSRFDLQPSLAKMIESFSFYTLVVFFFLFALKISNIPLTIFNLIGGALAIGVGFGSQNIVNNFISGLILMAESPFKIGDYIEIEGVFGKIEDIGTRSTQILSTGNHHIIVPNSKLLENKLYNWTLRDKVIRTLVRVGVAYGSPIEKVEELLKKSLEENNEVISTRETLVVFDDFSESSLKFELYFFIRLKDHLSEKRVQSLVRKKIDELFKENQIVIAFPQRDIHLSSKGAIPVKIEASTKS